MRCCNDSPSSEPRRGGALVTALLALSLVPGPACAAPASAPRHEAADNAELAPVADTAQDTAAAQETAATQEADTQAAGLAQDTAAAQVADTAQAAAAQDAATQTAAAAQDTAAAPAADEPPATLPLAERPRPADARALLAGFAQVTSLQADFREEKQLALLAVPLVSTGRLHFLAPGYLARVVLTPEPGTLLITPDSLRVDDRDGSQTIDLRSSGALRLFVTSLVRVFSGDEQALRESYELAWDAPADSAAWTLTLTPKAAPLNGMLRSLALAGTGQLVQRIVVVEPNGDRAVTTLSDVDPSRSYSAEERQTLFGIAPPR